MNQAVMTGIKKLSFYEGEFMVKTLESEEELRQSYQLRHRVFAERLRWVPETENRLETDVYDAWSTSIGVFSDWDELLGIVRMTHAPVPFMIESEFSACMVGAHCVRKELDTAEITRLAVDPGIAEGALSAKVMRTVIKGSYQWCLANDIRYTYLVVENRMLRALRLMGWPCRPIGEPVALPPALVVSIAALIDLDEFRSNAARRRPEILEWFSMMDNVQVAPGSVASLYAGTSSTKYGMEGEGRNQPCVQM